MKPSRIKWSLIISSAWALLPWLLWAVFQFHKPDHASLFWMLAMPFVFISFILMLLIHGDTYTADWFPMAWVFGCSVFNLAFGLSLSFVIRVLDRPRPRSG
jgi:hypothetical protein